MPTPTPGHSDSPELQRLLRLKRYEVPPPGFHERLHSRILQRLAEERARAASPWWERWLEEVNWQRGMAVANALSLAGVAILGVSTYQLAHTLLNEEEEGQVYAALPLPHERSLPAGAADDESSWLAQADHSPLPSPLPATGMVVPAASRLTPMYSAPLDPQQLFSTPSAYQDSGPRFILTRGQP